MGADADPDGGERRLHAVVVTYRRPDVVRRTVEQVLAQTLVPVSWTVVDNEPSEIARGWASGLPGGMYIASEENLGPAGGIARGLSHVLDQAGDEDMVLLVDDDDPPPFPDAVERLVRLLNSCPPEVAAAGLTGARFDLRLGLIRRVQDDELDAITDVDFIGGNQLPIYRVAALREVGVFDPTFFFGCEELEFGLRLRASGRRLVVDREIVMEVRRLHGRIGVGPRTAGKGLAPWRRYYSARNLVHVTRRYGGRRSAALAAIHAGPVSAARTLVRRRRSEAWMALVGVSDALRGRWGRVYVPG